MQRVVQQQGSGGPDRFFYQPLQDSLRYLSAAISGYREHFDLRMAFDLASTRVGLRGIAGTPSFTFLQQSSAHRRFLDRIWQRHRPVINAYHKEMVHEDENLRYNAGG